MTQGFGSAVDVLAVPKSVGIFYCILAAFLKKAFCTPDAY